MAEGQLEAMSKKLHYKKASKQTKSDKYRLKETKAKNSDISNPLRGMLLTFFTSLQKI